MSDQTSRILNKISEDEKLIEVYTLYFESLEKNFQRSEKLYQRNADENKNLTKQQKDKNIIFINKQLLNVKTTMLRFQNLQRARFLKQ